jgi:hypothetical protein
MTDYADPAMDIYRAAQTSLAENRFVNNPSLSEYDRIYLRGIQGTWKVKQDHLASRGHSYRMMFVWDYDRIWGSFDLGYYKGVLMVDHGSRCEPLDPSSDDNSDDPEPTYFDFTWRGTCTGMPDTLINNPLITKGKIEFGHTEISGYFEGMMGLPDSRCNFEGENMFGPRRVPRSLQSLIDEWNELNDFGEEESIQPAPAAGADVSLTHSNSRSAAEDHGDRPDQLESDEEDEYDDGDDEGNDPEEALRELSGLYDISCETVAEEWPDRAGSLSLHMHVDRDEDKIWGQFDIGICEGYFLMQPSAEKFVYGKCLKFDYRGREDGTGKSVRGTGEVTLSGPCRVTGTFRGIYGDGLRFKGKRRLMPSGISGRDVSLYRNGWEEYGHHLDRWR